MTAEANFGLCKRLRPLVAILAAAVVLGSSNGLQAASESSEAEYAWQAILEQSAGPSTRPTDRDTAVATARAHLDKQEAALRDFIGSYPEDPHRYSARIRLASVLAAKARFLNQAALNAEAAKMLSELEANPLTPAPIRADAGFAAVSQAMEDASARAEAADREVLIKQIRRFDAEYPGDRRVAGLLTEVANLYDDQPTQKLALLDEAAKRATDPVLQQRIADDTRRLALLNHPLSLRLQPWQGGPPIDLAARRGRPVVLLFWASWSMPSLHEMVRLQQTAKEFAGRDVDFLTVSLDEDRQALAATIDAAKLRWPVHCDGRGWKGELVRSLGLNALPTVWVLDRDGKLLDLNVHGEQTARLIHQALAH